ncbi:DUF2489 domain-containing protein [Haemophilus haemoglobinophilus]|nr:DUF2489 domain-containing protein [Canicola haemoglobinophilus]MBN6711767.1 DUF2489 domain-containing protein [Canicola haemoglobinophilus]
MWTTILIILALLIISAMLGYAIYLLLALQKQKKAFSQAKLARTKRLKESCEIIAKAMQSGECNLSEGVIRLKMLLDPLGHSLRNYSSMYQLYEVVMDMPTHDARRTLKKNERMRLDLQRESAEADLEQKIKLELQQFLNAIEKI